MNTFNIISYYLFSESSKDWMALRGQDLLALFLWPFCVIETINERR